MMQPNVARRADVHGRTLAHVLHAAEHFDRVSSVVAVTAAVSGGDRGHDSVFCFGFYDGSIDLFGGHSAPRGDCPDFLRTRARLLPKRCPSFLTKLRLPSMGHESTSSY